MPALRGTLNGGEEPFFERLNMRSWLMSLAIVILTAAEAFSQAKTPAFVVPTEVMGKRFTDWVKEIHAVDPSRREEAMKTILLFGPDKAYEAVPEILKELSKHKKFPVDLSVRVNGTMALSTILRYKKEPDPAHLKEALAIYKMFLGDSQAVMRVRAVQGLPVVGPLAREALDEVIKVAKDPSTWEVRKEGIQTLAMLAFDAKGPDPRVMAELRKSLDDPSAQVRLAALNAFTALSQANLGTKEELFTTSKLNSLLQSEADKNVIIWTHVTIMALNKKVTKLHVESIVKMLKQPDVKTRLQSLQAISSLGPQAKPFAAKAVTEAANDVDSNVALSAIVALVRIEAVEAIPILQSIASDKKASQSLRDTADDAVDQLKKVKAIAK